MKTFYLVIFAFLISTSVLAQDSLMHFNVESQATFTTNDQVPFWFRSNQFGSIPLSGASASFIGRFRKDYNPNKKKLIDWGVGFEGRTNLGRKAEGDIIEAYGKLRVGVFELKAGRSKDVMGLVGDSSLSSGSFAVSGNALGVPKIQLSIPEYYTLPILGDIFAIKGSFAHGWLGDIPINSNRLNSVQTYYHQTAFYGRIGKPDWRLKIYGGINHQAFWGNSKKVLPIGQFKLTKLQEFWAAASGQEVGGSKVGNHIGSVDFGVDYQFSGVLLKVYRQNIYDIGAIGHLANLKDGLNGLTIINTMEKKSGFQWRAVLLEVLYTKSQAGEVGKKLASGAEDYYNNYQYPKGWSYDNLNLGSSFLTNRLEAKDNLSSLTPDFIVNNRVIVYHLGFIGSVKDVLVTGKVSFSQNYGTYETSGGPYRYIKNITVYASKDIEFHTQNQISSYLSIKKNLANSISAGLSLGIDQGTLLNNSFGMQAMVSKSF
jgi:hypothetical protein